MGKYTESTSHWIEASRTRSTIGAGIQVQVYKCRYTGVRYIGASIQVQVYKCRYTGVRYIGAGIQVQVYRCRYTGTSI